MTSLVPMPAPLERLDSAGLAVMRERFARVLPSAAKASGLRALSGNAAPSTLSVVGETFPAPRPIDDGSTFDHDGNGPDLPDAA